MALIGEATGQRNLNGCQAPQEGLGANDPLLQLVGVWRHSKLCSELPQEIKLTQARNRQVCPAKCLRKDDHEDRHVPAERQEMQEHT